MEFSEAVNGVKKVILNLLRMLKLIENVPAALAKAPNRNLAHNLKNVPHVKVKASCQLDKAH